MNPEKILSLSLKGLETLGIAPLLPAGPEIERRNGAEANGKLAEKHRDGNSTAKSIAQSTARALLAVLSESTVYREKEIDAKELAQLLGHGLSLEDQARLRDHLPSLAAIELKSLRDQLREKLRLDDSGAPQALADAGC